MAEGTNWAIEELVEPAGNRKSWKTMRDVKDAKESIGKSRTVKVFYLNALPEKEYVPNE